MLITFFMPVWQNNKTTVTAKPPCKGTVLYCSFNSFNNCFVFCFHLIKQYLVKWFPIKIHTHDSQFMNLINGCS